VALVHVMGFGAVVCAQESAEGSSEEGASASAGATIHGRVMNRVTGEVVARALVVRTGNDAATLTDDRGQFELPSAGTAPGLTPTDLLKSRRGGIAGNLFVGVVSARRPGYIQDGGRVETGNDGNLTIYLTPEALIVGHVTVPGSDGAVRIECELYRHEMSEGRASWDLSGTFRTWATGEFRFSGLRAGTYRLITREEMDRDSMAMGPGAQLYGYPPVYYPNTTDFSAASAITIKAGETAQANVRVERRAYYPVRIPVGLATNTGMQLNVYPMGHWGPGWSLGFNPMERAITGLLPDGNYTVEASTFGESAASGVTNFAVKGAPLEGTALRLLPNASVTVNVTAQFAKGQGAEGDGQNATNVPLNAYVQLMRLDGQRVGGQQGQLQTGERSMTIPAVPPGNYRVKVMSPGAYVASMDCGGTDLLKQPLVVGAGTSVPAIEMVLRDDGGEVDGTVLEAGSGGPQSDEPRDIVYLLPSGETSMTEPQVGLVQSGNFRILNVAPGDYVAFAYPNDRNGRGEPAFGDETFLKKVKEMGQAVHVEAGQTVSVRLKALASGE